MSRLLLVLVVGALCSGCGDQDSNPQNPTTGQTPPASDATPPAVVKASCGPPPAGGIAVDDSQSGSVISAAVGQARVVSLPTGGGYVCKWSMQMGRSGVLESQGEPQYVADQPNAPGSAGRACFHLKANRVGGTPLAFACNELAAPHPTYRTVQYGVTVR